MQFPESVRRDGRSAEGHSSTNTGVNHPVWQYRYGAGCHLDMDNPAARTLFNLLHPQSSAVERVPTIVNIDFLLDMGRMAARWPWAAITGRFSAATAAARRQQCCAASWLPVS
jgi:hypothetical protein